MSQLLSRPRVICFRSCSFYVLFLFCFLRFGFVSVVIVEKRLAPVKRFSPRIALPQILLNLKNGNVGMLADQLRNIGKVTSHVVVSFPFVHFLFFFLVKSLIH